MATFITVSARRDEFKAKAMPIGLETSALQFEIGDVTFQIFGEVRHEAAFAQAAALLNEAFAQAPRPSLKPVANWPLP